MLVHNFIFDQCRWKLRQRKVTQSSSTITPPSTLYGMSYPLVQFSSDTVTKTGSARALRINLISLLLSGLADVVIFGEVEAIIELFHHHKVLYKCLDLARDVLSSKVWNMIKGE